jgi:hypothetical protein
MLQEQYDDITLHLNMIRDLFNTPISDPLSGNACFVSGIDILHSELRSRSLRHGATTRLRICLPVENIEPDLASKTHEALHRYCQFRLWQNKNTLVELHRAALKALLIGTLFLMSGLVVSDFLSRLLFLPGFLSTLFGDGFSIAFWVILWRPVDFFLFDLWPFWRLDRVYKYMMDMEVIISKEE